MVRPFLPRYGSGYSRLLPRLERLQQDLTRTNRRAAEEEEDEDEEGLQSNGYHRRGGGGGGWSSWGEAVGRGLGGPWALATLLAATSLSTAPSHALPSALLAFLSSLVSGLCFLEMETVWRKGRPAPNLYRAVFGTLGEFPAFVVGWAWVCCMACSQAGAARAVTALVDSACGGHLRQLGVSLFGPESPLGFFLDFPAFAVAALPSILCACGLEDSPLLRLGLNTGVALATVTITLTGLTAPEPTSLPPVQDTSLAYSLLHGAGVLSLGCIGVWGVGGQARRFHRPRAVLSTSVALGLSASLLSTMAIASVLPLWATSAPLAASEQSLGVGAASECPLAALLAPREGPGAKHGVWWWLRLASVCLSIWSVGLALVEASLGVKAGVVRMARDGLLHRKLADISQSTGAPIRAVLAFGGASASLALLLDLPTLIGMAASAALVTQILLCTVALQLRYQTDVVTPPSPVLPDPETVRESRNQAVVCFLKDGFQDLPTTIVDEEDYAGGACSVANSAGESSSSGHRKASTSSWSSSGASTASTLPCTALLGTTEEGPPLKRSEVALSRLPLLDESPSSGLDTDSSESDDSDETDIDAVVAEYVERVGVATLTGLGSGATATPATARRVSLALVALLACAAAQALALAPGPAPGQQRSSSPPSALALQLATALVAFLLLALILRQPQRRPPTRVQPGGGPWVWVPLCPWSHAAALFLNAVLLLCGLRDSALFSAAWWGIGLIVYFSYGIHHSVAATSSLLLSSPDGSLQERCSSRRRRPYLHVKKPSCLISQAIARREADGEDSDYQHLTRVDTILIAR